MDKRYQVFVSSTYTDLKDERQSVIRAVMELDCIPAGMELFPAADEEQFEFIKRVINDCDYYLVIIGGRYGSITEKGVSYTEQEYDYAVSRGLKVIALLHENPDEIPLGKSEKDEVLRQKLQQFRDKVKEGRLVKFWKSAEDLAGKVALSLSQTIKTYPAVGWVRADKVANEQILGEINQVRKRNAEVQTLLQSAIAELERLKSPPLIEGLAEIDEEIELLAYYIAPHGKRYWAPRTTWRKLFASISPFLESRPYEYDVDKILASSLFVDERKTNGNVGHSARLDDQSFQTITVQLKALGLVKVAHPSPPSNPGGPGIWSLTPRGEILMMELRTVRSKTTTPAVTKKVGRRPTSKPGD